MKKVLALLIMCMVLVSSLTTMCAMATQVEGQIGYDIVFNGEMINYTSVMVDNIHNVPIRKICEKMGAVVFFRQRDNQVLVLTRNGDMVSHKVGSTTISVNGQVIKFNAPSIVKNNETYISAEMLLSVFCPDAIYCENKQLIIQKQFVTNSYHVIVKDVLDLCRNSNFHPERFQRYVRHHNQNPNYSVQDIIFRTNLGLDFPFYENIKIIEHPHELLVLVNKYNQLPSDFMQYNLVNMDKEYTVNDGKQYLLLDTVYQKYVQMYDAGKRDGVSLKVLSAYRTEDYQRKLYNDSVWSSGRTYADNYSARPGFSEHQTGMAVDITSTSGSFENTREFAWLQQHAHEYGFVMRYPKGKEWITGYSYEPWHYRYVGADVAKIMHDYGLTYEEYHAMYIDINEFR